VAPGVTEDDGLSPQVSLRFSVCRERPMTLMWRIGKVGDNAVVDLAKAFRLTGGEGVRHQIPAAPQ